MSLSTAIALSKERTTSCRNSVGLAIQRVKAAGGIGGLANAMSGGVDWPGVKIDERKAASQYGTFRDIPYTAIRPIAVKIASLPLRVGHLSEERKMSKQDMVTKDLRDGYTPKRMLRDYTGLYESSPVFVKSVADRVEMADDHQFLIDMRRPNPIMDRWSLFYCTAVSMYITGRSYWWVERVGGKESKEGGRLIFWYLPTTWVKPVPTERDPFASFRVKVPETAGEGWSVKGEDMVVFSFPDPQNPIASFSPLQANARPIDVDDMIQQAQLVTMRDAPQPKVILHAGRLPTAPGMSGAGERPVLTPNQRSQLVAAIKMAYAGAAKSGEPFIIDGLIENITPFGRGPAELDFQNSSALTKSRIMEGIGVNPIVTGQVEGANRASAVVADVYFYHLVVNPLAMLMSEAMTAKIAPKYEEDKKKPLLLWLEEAQARDPDQVNGRVTLGLQEPGIMTKGELRHYIETGEIKIAEKDDDDEPTTGPGGGMPGDMGDEPGAPEGGAGQPSAPPEPDEDEDDEEDDDWGAWDNWKSASTDPLECIWKGVEIGRKRGLRDALELLGMDEDIATLVEKGIPHYDKYRKRDGKFGNAPSRAPDRAATGDVTEDDPGLDGGERRSRKRGGGSSKEAVEHVSHHSRKDDAERLKDSALSARSMADIADGKGTLAVTKTVNAGGKPRKDGTRGKRVGVVDIIYALDRENGRKKKRLSLSKANQAAIADAIVDEVISEMAYGKKAGDWYEADIRAAIEIVGEQHPEVLNDKDPRSSLFRAIMAITSNGNEVEPNARMALDTYEAYKASGFKEAKLSQGSGPRETAINEALQIMQDAVNDPAIGLETFVEFLNRDYTAGRLKKWREILGGAFLNQKSDDDSEVKKESGTGTIAANAPAHGSFIFGPKIGAFYRNLSEDFDHVTMDLWFMRTVHRILGNVGVESPDTLLSKLDSKQERKPGQAERFLTELEQAFAGEGKSANSPVIDLLRSAGINDTVKMRKEYAKLKSMMHNAERLGKTELAKAANIVRKYYEKSKGVSKTGKEFKTYGERTELNNAGKELASNIFTPKAAPKNASDRKIMEGVVSLAISRLKDMGYGDVKPATIQALMWGFEKRLWKSMGYNARGSDLINYSGAFQKLYEQRAEAVKKEKEVVNA